MSLYVTELRRLSKRRLTRLLLALLVLGLAGIAVALGLSSTKIGPAQRAAAEAQVESEYQQAVRSHQQNVADCEAAKARGEKTEERFGPDCGRQWVPEREMYDAKWYLPYEFDMRSEFGLMIAAFAGAVSLFAFLVGASFVGAEWNTGGMMNLLLWRPKRATVLLTKLAAVLSVLLGLGVVLGLLWTGAIWLVARFSGSTAKMTAGVWESFAISGLRAVGLVLAVGVVAFGLASLGRHTAMALGAAVGVGVLSEIGIQLAVQLAQVRFGQRYVLSTYALAWFEKKWTLVDHRSCEFARGMCNPAEFVVTWQQSALVFGVGTVLVLAAAVWSIRRRDI
ncbi:ABC transporter permease subunit [Micromonospora echinofusca]|uniref:ABC transporter permease subunit n=1 Tax=Micromonospora echinofusca TaxID=47858 RepID=A0ABS3VPS8_MICEH|nr:ABC transporter permease subunit [Micromonospora echinofusca]MBO4206544.1 ABC transporter permease subunit [Micromonospora echinofusca]